MNENESVNEWERECAWVDDWTVENPPYFSQSYENSPPPTAGIDRCGRVVVVVGGCGGTYCTAITYPSYVLSLFLEREWMN